MEGVRKFMPAVAVTGLRVPVHEFAQVILRRIHESGKAQEWLKYYSAMNFEDAPDETVIGFPMVAHDFIVWGCMLSDFLYSLCAGGTVEEANEFLSCYGDGAGEAPADLISGALYISDDGGDNWMDLRRCWIPRKTEEPAAPQRPTLRVIRGGH